MSRVSFIPVCFLALAASAENGKIPVTTSSEEARSLFQKGRDLVEKLRGADALPFFEKAVAKDPQFATAYLNLANTAPTNKEFFAALEMMSAPLVVNSERPVLRSSALQISCERTASGVYCAPSPIASRVIRVSPCDEPSPCGGENRSMPRTLTLRAASW